MEQDYSDGVVMIARARNSTIAEFISSVDAERTNINLSSALRLIVLTRRCSGPKGASASSAGV
jgi:predicted DNA-binding ribbon-helix-helix protein